MRLRPLALAAALVVGLAACGSTPVPSDTPTPAISAEPTAPTLAEEPPLSERTLAQPVPKFLDEEQKALFLHAYEAAQFLLASNVPEYPRPDGSTLESREPIEVGDENRYGVYEVATGRYGWWADFKAMVEDIFTPEYLAKLGVRENAPLEDFPCFTSTQEGRLCYLAWSKGDGDPFYSACDTPDSYELVSQSETEITFRLIGHYVTEAYFNAPGTPEAAEETTRSFPIRMVKTDAGWRVAQFHLPYVRVLAEEPPLSEWTLAQPVPEFLDEEQKALFLHAYEASSFLFCGTAGYEHFLPEDDTWTTADYVVIDDMTYLVAQGRYARWEDFKAMMDGLFTAEYQDDLLNTIVGGISHPLFTSTEDGRLCFLDTQMGSDLEYGWCDTPDSYELVSQSEDEIVFDIIGHYVHLGYDPENDIPVPQDEYTQAYPIRMELTGQGWRVAEFHRPF